MLKGFYEPGLGAAIRLRWRRTLVQNIFIGLYSQYLYDHRH